MTNAISTIKAELRSAMNGVASRAIRESGAAHTGDYVGLSGKDILCGDADRGKALLELAGKLHAGNYDLALLLSGADVPAEEAAAATETLAAAFPRTEITLVEGGQPVYDYILLLC